MTPLPETPTRLPHADRRRTAPRPRAAWKLKLVTGLLAIFGTVASGYYSGIAAVGDRDRAQIERIARLEERTENQYKAILGRLDDLKANQETYRQDARADINGIRDEILRILRER